MGEQPRCPIRTNISFLPGHQKQNPSQLESYYLSQLAAYLMGTEVQQWKNKSFSAPTGEWLEMYSKMTATVVSQVHLPRAARVSFTQLTCLGAVLYLSVLPIPPAIYKTRLYI